MSVPAALRWGQGGGGDREEGERKRRREKYKGGRKEGGEFEGEREEGREEGRKEKRKEEGRRVIAVQLYKLLSCTFLFTGAPALLRDWLFSWGEREEWDGCEGEAMNRRVLILVGEHVVGGDCVW